MTISTQDFTTLVRGMVASVQAGAIAALDLSVGSVIRATIEAVAGVSLWLESQILYVLTLTRAATSSGSDLDSWVADFGLTRLAATAATGTVTFARFTATNQAVIPLNTSIQTSDGTQQFIVALDTTNPAYSAALGGYVVAPSVTSLNVLVQAVNVGTGGNVLAGTITAITQAIPGIDTVTNAAAFTNGEAAETDGALRTRFVAYISSLSKATKGAVGYAITSIQSGLVYLLTENQDYNGTTDYGYFYVVCDDGSGYPSSTLLSTINNSIDAVRGVGLRFGVFAPVVVTATPTMTITSASGLTHATVVGAVTTALETFINSLTLGTALPYTQLAAIAYGVTGVTNVTGVLLNGATADLTVTNQQVIKCGVPVVS